MVIFRQIWWCKVGPITWCRCPACMPDWIFVKQRQAVCLEYPVNGLDQCRQGRMDLCTPKGATLRSIVDCIRQEQRRMALYIHCHAGAHCCQSLPQRFDKGINVVLLQVKRLGQRYMPLIMKNERWNSLSLVLQMGLQLTNPTLAHRFQKVGRGRSGCIVVRTAITVPTSTP